MVNEGKKCKVFLSTGGSGGHIFPAIAIAEILTNKNHNIFIISDKIYEKYSNYNLNYRIISASKTIKSFSGIKNIIVGFLQSVKLIKNEKPDCVLGFGSYATLPMLLACVWTKTPLFIHEQNAYIGRINKLFGGYAKKIMTTYHEVYGVKYNDMNKILYTGSPIRKSIKNLYEIEYNYPNKDEKFVILITGGSAGARIFSEYLPKIFDEKHSIEQKNIMVYHQVREEYIETVREYYKKINLDAVIKPFFENMHELLEKAHLVIGRAGSGTLSEISVAGKPSILIPLTNRANNRQEVNAKSFKQNNASIIILEKDFNIKDFQTMFFDLIKDKEKLEEMSKNTRKISVIDAGQSIVEIISKNI